MSVLILMAPEDVRPRVMSARLRGEPCERAVYRAEDMGAAGWRGGDANRKSDPSVLVSACAEAGGNFEIGAIKILGCKSKIFV